MPRGAELVVKITTDASAAAKGVDQVAGKFDGFKSTLGNLAAPAAGVLGAIVAGAGVAVAKASDLEQAFGAVDAVFGKNADTVKAWAADASDALGISSREYAEFASVIGAGLKNAGLPMEEVASKTDELIRLGADLAATYGGSTTDAVNALGSALRGEADPAEKYGLSLKQGAVNAELAASGQDKLTGAALDTAKAQAILKLATEQAGGAVGAAGREMDTVAGQQAKLNAKTEEMAAALGTALLPIVEPLVAKLAEFAGWVAENASVITPLIAAVAALAAGILILNVVMAANPIGLIIIAVLALIAGIVALWTTNEDFRNFFIGIWTAIAGFFTALWEGALGVVRSVIDWFRSAWTNVSNVFKVVWAVAVAVVRAYFQAYISFFTAIFNVVRAVVNAVVRFFVSAWEGAVAGVTAVVKTLQGIFTTVFDAIMVPINAVVSAFQAVIGAIKSVIDWLGRIKIPDFLGGLGDLIGGLSVAAPAALGGVSTYTGRSVGGLSGRSSTGGGGVTINVQGGLDSADAIARRVHQLLDGRARRTGGVTIHRSAR